MCEVKQLTPGLFFFFSPNMAGGVHGDGTWKGVVLTGGKLRCLTFPITCAMSAGASPKQV